MKSIFAITTATDAVRLDSNRQGEILFTVSNTSEQPIRGRAQIVPAAGTPTSWFTIAGGAEREFATNGTQQVAVQVQLPQEAAPGRYLVRLDIIGIQNPDEEFSEGPTVTVEVAPARPTKKPFPWWIVAVALFALCLLAAVAFILIRQLGGGEPITNLADILEVMEIEELATDRPVYNAGDNVTFTYNLTNQSRSTVIPDSNNNFGQPLVGVRQHFIERLGNDPDIPELAANARDGNRFAIGGAIIPVEGELAPGDQISFLERLATTNFPAGDYRLSVEYRDLDGTVIQTEDVEFELR